jgi:exodeoxyribonuclease VII large subunit
MREMIFSVDKISDYIKDIFESDATLHDIRIKGEVSNYSESKSNAYFVLKGSRSQINCVYFAVDLRDYVPKNGDSCIARGSVTYYKAAGKVSFYVTDIQPAGMGDAYLKLLQLKDRLEREGIFDERHKVGLPYFAKKVGVITSKSGAVIHDIIKTARKNYPGVDIVLYPTSVQGSGSADEIAEGLRAMDRAGVDVIVVARGGGSAEDLAAYNTETVARVVFECKTPVISAVGHETDFTLCDLAADARAATPTAAAQMVVPDAEMLCERILGTLGHIRFRVTGVFARAHGQLKSTLFNMFNVLGGKLEAYAMRIKLRGEEIKHKAENTFNACEARHAGLLTKIEANNPLSLLKKGYGFVSDEEGRPVTTAKALKSGQLINIAFADGSAEAEVKKMELRSEI